MEPTTKWERRVGVASVTVHGLHNVAMPEPLVGPLSKDPPSTSCRAVSHIAWQCLRVLAAYPS